MATILTAKEVKEKISIVNLLDRLGYQPVPKKGREQMYISMLRDNDSNPSLSVNDELGFWYDHGTGKGGNIIDFGLAYWHNLQFAEVIRKIQEVCYHDAAILHEPVQRPALIRERQPKNYAVTDIKRLGTHPAITVYLRSRGIFDQARQHLSEVYYYIENDAGMRQHYFAAGWQNQNEGWEVRNKFFKGCIGPKGLSTIPGDPKKLAVFEGYLDFLSWRKEQPDSASSVVVLNTLTLLTPSIEHSKSFSSIDIYFDRDPQGTMATAGLIKALPYATDRSSAFQGFKDYNDKIKSFLPAGTQMERSTDRPVRQQRTRR